MEIRRVTLILPDAIVRRIDAANQRSGETTRSRFIRDAIREKLQANEHLHALLVEEAAEK